MMALNSNSLPTIHSYADCDTLFKRKLAELPRHRRARAEWSETKLPLDDWRKEHIRIELKDSGEYYGLVYHSTTVLGYYQDGRVFFNASWDTRSTHTFFDELSPYSWRITRARGARFYRNGHGTDSKWYALPLDGYFWLDADGQPTNPQDFHYKVEVSNRVRRKELREIMKPFYTWYHALTRATGSMLAVMEDPALFNNSPSQAQRVVVEYARMLGQGSLTEDTQWRHLVHNAWAATLRFWGMREASKHDVDEWGAKVLKHIEDDVWRHCGGFKDEERTVKAGDKP